MNNKKPTSKENTDSSKQPSVNKNQRFQKTKIGKHQVDNNAEADEVVAGQSDNDVNGNNLNENLRHSPAH